jgi:hypothetical protein
MAHVRDWRTELIEAHPALFRPPAGHPEAASGYPWCEEGWRDLLERLCVRIKAALREGETIRVLQVKEKFAALRFSWSAEVSPETRTRIAGAVALAEARSACTCEECGDEGELYRHGGVYMTRCAGHAKGQPVPAEPGRENCTICAGRRVPPTCTTRGTTARPTALPRFRRPRRNRRTSMARFLCGACGQEGDFIYQAGRHTCPRCGSTDVQFALGIEELPDDDPLFEAMERPAEENDSED